MEAAGLLSALGADCWTAGVQQINTRWATVFRMHKKPDC